MDKLLKKLGIKDQNSLLLYGGIAAVAGLLTINYLKKGSPLAFYSSYDTSTTTTTTGPTVQELKDKILQNIIQRAQDVNVVITNLQSINAKIDTYNAKLELLTSEIAGSRLPTYVVQQYLQNIIKEIAESLNIKLNLPMAGGWGGSYSPYYSDPLGGYADQNSYSQYYQDYIRRLQDYYSQYSNQFAFYDPQSYWYTPNYYYNQVSPYYSYQQTYNPGYQTYNSQQYSYSYPYYGNNYPQSQGYGQYPSQGGYSYPYY